MMKRFAALSAAMVVATAVFFWVPIRTAIAYAWVNPRFEDVVIGDAVARIYFPVSYTEGAGGRRANLFLHGNGQNHTVFLGADALSQIANGDELFAVIDGQDAITPPFKNDASGWGNSTYQKRYVDLYRYLRRRFKIAEGVDVIGASMGGLAMGHFIVAKPFPITRAFGLGPVPFLDALFEKGGDRRKIPIRNAFRMSPDGRDDARLHQFAHDAFWTDDLAKVSGHLPPLMIAAGSADNAFKVEFGGEQAYRVLCSLYKAQDGTCSYKIFDGLDHDNYSMLSGILEEALKPPKSEPEPVIGKPGYFTSLRLMKTCRPPCEAPQHTLAPGM